MKLIRMAEESALLKLLNNDDISEDDEETYEDIGEVADDLGYEKSKDNMFLFGATRDVTILSKVENVEGLDVDTQYLINPKTGAWIYKIRPAETDENFVEIKNGEDPNSLLKHLKSKHKISTSQIENYF